MRSPTVCLSQGQVLVHLQAPEYECTDPALPPGVQADRDRAPDEVLGSGRSPRRSCRWRSRSMAVLIFSSPRSAREDDHGALLIRRENGTYNVDRARTWLRESGRQVQPPCRGVRQLRRSRPLIGWSPCRYVGVSAGGAGAGTRAGGGRGGRGGCQWCVHRGPGWRCCTFIPGCWSGWWRHSNVFPPREAEVSRMNVQRGRRCTFILVPRPRPSSRSA